MNKIFYLFISVSFFSCGSGNDNSENNTDSTNVQVLSEPMLICVRNADYEPAFVNEKGDTIIPFGKYAESFTDTIYTFGSVYDTAKGFIGIDIHGAELFEIFAFDNGPDYVEDGMFRIVKDSLIGYADELGNIVIEPQFECAWPFENGKAQVSKNCTETIEFEMTKWESEEWFYIDKTGKVISE
jgi:hypothetical protein